MPIPELATTAAPATEWEGDVLVVGVRTDGDAPVLALPAGLDAGALGLADLDPIALGASGSAGDLVRIPAAAVAARSIGLLGIGAGDADDLRAAAGAATRRIRGVASVGFALPVVDATGVLAVLEGAGLGAYVYTAYRGTPPTAAKAPVERVDLLTDVALPDGAVDRIAVLVDSVRLVKDLVNTPPLDLYPASLALIAEEAAAEVGAASRVWDEQALAEGGFGGILGVGAGSARPPRLVRIGWAPEGATTTVALVGKGITFDSGGLSLKPPVSMVGMKYDMTGAAVVLAVALAAARLALPVAVTAWLCIAENLPSGTAIRPNDVLRIRGGTTVEVLNTDAEGRLVLADGLVAASEEHPDAIIDVATLTGAAATALGTRHTGAMGDPDLVGRVSAAGRTAGEAVWHMPLPAELRALLRSDIADVANAKPGNTAGGMLLAGTFLADFVGPREDGGGTIPWAHLDIAATANNAGSAYGHVGTGPTGVAVRTLIALLESAADGVVDRG